MVASAIAVAAAVVAPFAGTPNPTFVAETYDMTVATKGSLVRHIVDGPERFSSNPSNARLPDVVARGPELWFGATRDAKGRRIINRYQVAPDAITGPDDLGLKLAHFAVAEARAGKLTLTPEVIAGRQTLRAEIDLPANSCKKLVEGTATIWLTRTTLLPKRLEVERDGEVTTWTYRFQGFNQDLDLSVVRLGPAPTRVSNGFRRRTPAVASGPLAFVPRLPKVLPSGFKLVASGWAPRGARTGVRDLNKRDPSLFSAVYQKGWERIEITERVAANGTWKRDPFGELCLSLQPGRTTVNGRPARYGIGPEIPSHLWWRDGPLLYTISGPYGKRDLAAIAASMQKIS